MRFVTGKIAQKKPSSMKVKVPAGDLGIEGTIVELKAAPSGPAVVVLLGPAQGNDAGARAGRVSVSYRGQTRTITRPDFAVTMVPGGEFSGPFRASAKLLDSLAAALSLAPAAGKG